MSVSLYAYDPDRCDGDICPCDCQFCSKNHENGGNDYLEEEDDIDEE